MRQRKIKDIDVRLQSLSHLIADTDNKGHWRTVFLDRKDTKDMRDAKDAASERKLYAEIGCGKGKFINEYAAQDQQNDYIGIEGHTSVILRALQKADESELDNVLFICQYIRDLRDIFDADELDGIFLNFSDPWPKKRHAKRRLTHTNFLKTYMEVVRPGGFIQFKTDNDGLFEFTMEEIERNDFKVAEYSEDLHSSGYTAKDITTEYENKFMILGKNINYVKLEVD